MLGNKRALGAFYTRHNPFVYATIHPAFQEWATQAGLPHTRILEPFAGENLLIQHLQGMGLCGAFASFDIAPAHSDVVCRDTLRDFPRGFEVCVTNPPWLAKNSATSRGIAFPQTHYDDLYKYALDKCLAHCGYVAAIIPESFIRSGLFHHRLDHFISISGGLFTDTNHPTALALFAPHGRGRGNKGGALLWSDTHKIGRLDEILSLRPQPNPSGVPVVFNSRHANLGLFALDNTIEASIRFCPIAEIAHRVATPSDRAISQIEVGRHISLAVIDAWNARLAQFRRASGDMLMTAYRGLRQDGKYRRRLDWQLARAIMQTT